MVSELFVHIHVYMLCPKFLRKIEFSVRNRLIRTRIFFGLFMFYHGCRCDVWDFWLAIINHIQRRVSRHERVQKASTLEALNKKFREAFNLVAGDNDYNYYFHALHMHLPGQIRVCPVDIMDASGNGIEQVNQKLKRLSR